MSATPNLAIEHLLQSQAQKEVTANEAFDALDQAMSDFTTIDVSAGNTTVSAEDFTRSVLLVLTGTPAASLDLTVPASKRLFIVQNDCGRDVAVTAGAGALILTAGQRRLLYCDGTNVIAVAPDFASTGGGGGGGGGGFPVFKGALIKRTTNVTVASSAQITLDWQSAVYDTDGFVNLGAQPTRLAVPAGQGITRAQVLCGVQWAPSSSGDRWVQILKNGIEVDGMRTNTTAVTAIGSWQLYRFRLSVHRRRGDRRGLRAVLRRVRRRLGRRHGRPLERQPARHALAGEGCDVRSVGWRWTAGRGAAAGDHRRVRIKQAPGSLGVPSPAPVRGAKRH
jgi:hypothetical protein